MIKDALGNKNTEQTELGFGSKNYSESVRFLNKDGSVNVRRRVSANFNGFDMYHWLIGISWAKFIGLVFLSYIMVNTFFAVIYYFLGTARFGGLESFDQSSHFTNLFFFSAQTLTTVGYGHVYPMHPSTNTVSAIESMFGLMGFALVTGLLYGRFSKPKANIQYSDEAVVAPYGEGKAVMFRIANKKQNELLETECQMILAINNKETKRRDFLFLKLERNRINFLPLTWTIVHPINENSPFYDLTEQDLKESDAEIVILIKAITDTYFQTVYSRMSYKKEEIVWNARYVPMKQKPHKDGSISINLTDIHQYEKL